MLFRSNGCVPLKKGCSGSGDQLTAALNEAWHTVIPRVKADKLRFKAVKQPARCHMAAHRRNGDSDLALSEPGVSAFMYATIFPSL